MKRNTSIVFSILLLIMLFLPLALTSIEADNVSDANEKFLSERQPVGSQGFAYETEAWLRNRLGMREAIGSVYSELIDRVFGELASDSLQYGKNKHVFPKIHSNIEYSEYHLLFAEMVAEIQNYCESRGTKFYYVFNPEKESTLKKYLPEGVNYSDEWVDDMLAEMDRLGVNYVDLRDVFVDIQGENALFNRQSDTYHWNNEGAFYGMQTLTKRIHNDIPEVSTLDRQEFDISSVVIKKTKGTDKIINEEVSQYSLKENYSDITGEFAKELVMIEPGTYFNLIQNDSEEAAGIERLLLFGDELQAPIAIARSKETAIVSCFQNVINFDYYYNIFKPDVVVLENMEYVVDDTHFRQTAMEEATYNPAIMEIFPEAGFADRKYNLLAGTQAIDSTAATMLIPGKKVDRLIVSNIIDKPSYAYLIADDRVIDLKDGGSGVMTASIRHGVISSGSDVVLYLLNDDGTRKYEVIPVSENKQFSVDINTSTGSAMYDKNRDKYIITNDVNDDIFSYAAVQLYNNDMTKQLATISASTASGPVAAEYSHELPTGDYKLMLKAWGDSINEWTSFNVHLNEGQLYWFVYNIDEFTAKKVTISGFSITEPAWN